MKGDYQLITKDYNILIEVKNYKNPVNQNEVDKFIRDIYSDFIYTHAWTCHAPKTVVKKDFFEMKLEVEKHFESIQKSKFRDAKNPSILANFYPRWMIHKNK